MHACILCCLATALAASDAAADAPRAVDERLVIEPFTAPGELVTPTGLAVDDQGRVFVVESHTHFRPEGYTGPAADRIRLFEDTDGDGRADKISTFFEGTQFTMNVGLHPDGSLYVATRGEVFRLRDADSDGVAEDRTPIARLETAGNYPHNGLSGFAFDLEGNVFFGLGENLGADYRLVGTDGRSLAGGGEGGNIYRCRPDGSGLERLATGFWNPFHIAFDAFGRLYMVDNDPDSRPPCRLMHVVPGGDYGYRFRNGRKGLHPFTAWNGELPGTLPMTSGTGEAPSGMVAYESDNLPDDYRGELLVTSWGDHRLERYRLERRGASLVSTAVPFVIGGENFRPVGMALAPDGTLFVSDWVDKSYTLHGKGMLWRVRRAEAVTLDRPEAPSAALKSADGLWRARAARQLLAQGAAGVESLMEQTTAEDPRTRAMALQALHAEGNSGAAIARAAIDDQDENVRQLAASLAPPEASSALLELVVAESPPAPSVRAALMRRAAEWPAESQAGWAGPALRAVADPDPFLSQAARRLLASMDQPGDWPDLRDRGTSAELRLQALLLWRESARPERLSMLEAALGDADPAVRFFAVQWVAEEKIEDQRPRIEGLLEQENTTRQLFEGCLAALEMLDAQGPKTNPGEEIGGDEYVARVLLRPDAPAVTRRLALRVLRADHPALTLERLDGYLNETDLELRLEALRALRESPIPEAAERLRALAADEGETVEFRAEAIAGLAPLDAPRVATLVALAGGDKPVLRQEALRSLRGAELNPAQQKLLRRVAKADTASADLIARLLSPASAPAMPAAKDTSAWMALLKKPGDAAAGERVFFRKSGASCYRCHQQEGRGGRVGPDLSGQARAANPRRLVESILQPSLEVAPQFVPWSVVKTDGTVVSGLLLAEGQLGEQTYANPQGEIFMLQRAEVEERHPQATSIMPDNLATLLTAAEFRDLMTYLMQAR